MAPKCMGNHIMYRSAYLKGPDYSDYFCNQCKKSGNSERWMCAHCSQNICFECVAIEGLCREGSEGKS